MLIRVKRIPVLVTPWPNINTLDQSRDEANGTLTKGFRTDKVRTQRIKIEIAAAMLNVRCAGTF